MLSESWQISNRLRHRDPADVERHRRPWRANIGNADTDRFSVPPSACERFARAIQIIGVALIGVVLEVFAAVGLDQCTLVVQDWIVLLMFVVAELVDMADRKAGVRKSGIAPGLLAVLNNIVFGQTFVQKEEMIAVGCGLRMETVRQGRDRTRPAGLELQIGSDLDGIALVGVIARAHETV